MGISRDHWHKRRSTGGRRVAIRKKRKFELARPAAMTKLAPQRIHTLRVRGGQSLKNISLQMLMMHDKNIFLQAIRSTALCVWTRGTSPGAPRASPARPGSSTLCTTPPTTSGSEPRPSSRTPLSSLTPPHSDNGKGSCESRLFY